MFIIVLHSKLELKVVQMQETLIQRHIYLF